MKEDVSGTYKPGSYREEAIRYFRQCVGDEMYKKVMEGRNRRLRHAMAARVFLSQSDWEKFCWLEQHGSLDGFSGENL